MKRLLIVLMALLMLSGCGVNQASEPTAPTQDTQASEPEPTAPTRPLQTQNEDVLTAFVLPNDTYTALAPIGDSVAVLGQKMLLLTNGGIITVQLADAAYANAKLLSSSEDGMCYYDTQNRTVVLLNQSLEVTKQLQLPPELLGEPLADMKNRRVYYCVENEIRVMDMDTSRSRLLRKENVQEESLEKLCFGGEELLCRITGTNGDSYTAFFSTQTGELLGGDKSLLEFSSGENEQFLTRMDGTVEEWLYGGKEGELKLFTPRELPNMGLIPLLDAGGVVCVGHENGKTTMDFYDLSTARRTAELEIEKVLMPRGFCMQGGKIWFLLQREQDSEMLLCCWNLGESKTEDAVQYCAVRVSAEAPDTAALESCKEQARLLGEKYGVDIRLWTDVVAPETCTLEPEYQALAYGAGLRQLEQALAIYPSGFFEKVCADTSTGVLHICLVRSISDGSQVLQYYHNGDAWIALAIGDAVSTNCHNGIAHVMDTYIYAYSLGYDEWNELNPSGFEYDYNDYTYRNRTESPYLEGEEQAFVNSRAMSYPREDRAGVFEYALRKKQAELFEKPDMQEKLLTVCLAIRDAFGWKKETATFPWEQYLAQPLAYQET